MLKNTGGPSAEILCVGTELLAGKINTHAAYLSARLRSEGFELRREATLPDNLEEVSAALSEALSRSDAVLVCGGLGPTFDDLTREAAAAALGRALRYRPSLYARILRQYRRFRRRIPSSNRRQAWVIDGARILPNPRGSAPGQFLNLRSPSGPKSLALLPGPGSEMKPMFERQALPLLLRRHHPGGVRARASTVLRLYGIAESAADMLLAPLTRRPPAWAEYTILASLGLVDLHISVRGRGGRQARLRLGLLRSRALRLVGRFCFGRDSDTLESVLGERLQSLGWRLAAAESCTGGLLGERLTSVPGASRYFLGSVVAYDNAVKTGVLGVPEPLLRRHGAVSAECAEAMALGVKRLTGAEASVAVTGIAGPGGGTRAKPVGVVYLALSLPGLRRPRVRRFLFPGTREVVRERAAAEACHRLLSLIDSRSSKL